MFSLACCLEGAHAVPVDEVGTDEAVFAVDAYLVPSLDLAEALIAFGDISCDDIDCSDIDCTTVDASSWIEAASYWISGDNHAATWQSETVVTSVSTSGTHSFKYDDTAGTTTVSGHVGGKLVTDTDTTTIHYLGY